MEEARTVALPLEAVEDLDRVARCLAGGPGGWPFLGDAELLHVMAHGFEPVLLESGVAYRRASVPTGTAMRMVS